MRFSYAMGANAAHGLKRMNRDKVNAVMILLKGLEWPQWPNYEIVDRCNVSDEMVRQRRASLSIIGSERTYKTKHGTTATMGEAGGADHRYHHGHPRVGSVGQAG
jgi:hypothetical protein